jgi:hypothetical protein
MNRSLLRLLALAAASAMLVGACSSSGATGSPPVVTEAPQTVLPATETPAPTPTAAPTLASTPSSAPTALGLGGQWSGIWKDTSPDTSSGTFSLSWIQTGNNLAGSITVKGTPCLSGGTVTGTINGSSISFGAVSGQVKITYDGSISGNKMQGTYSAPTCGNAKGDWSATQG